MRRLTPLIIAIAALACGSGVDDNTSGSTGGAGGSVDIGGAGGGGEDVGGGGAGGAGGAGGMGCVSDLTPEPGLVITDNGAVRGQLAGDTYLYKGIPYAAPPVGPLRFRPPEPPECIDGVLEASAFGNVCPQPNGLGGVEGDEDCLTLNVWAPVAPPSSPRTVMVWIHGGGNDGGSSANGGDDSPMFDGQPYVEQADVVFVSINYRLGALGFMAHPALTAEDPNGSSGNNALLDQIAALEWVQTNIAHFGGDPNQVMVFGQSAGAVDICALMSSPLAAGLMHRVLMSSGACVARPLAQRETRGSTLASSLGCSSGDIPACLRALPATDFVDEQPNNSLSMVNPLGLGAMPFLPTVDGYVVPKHPLQALRDGDQNDVPFVIGSNSREASIAVQPVVTLNQYQQIVRDRWNQAEADLVLQLYDPQNFPTPRRALIALCTDVSWTCPARRVARAANASQTSSVYRHFFTHGLEGPAVQGLGAFHALDVIFVFQQSEAMSYTLNPAELALSQDMLGYWSRFAVTGDPNGGGAVAWPAYEANSDLHLVLDTTIAAGNAIRTARCDLLDSL